MDELTRYKMKIVFAGIVEAVLAIIEIYIMINFNKSFLAIAIVGLIMIIVLFFLISGVIDINLLTKEIEQQKYEELYNAQKASYLVIRKSFDEMEERLKSIEEGNALPADEIINAQKAVAKVTISRSKENTDALMNSNDELINQLFAMQEKIEENNDSLIRQQQELLDQVHQKMEDLNLKIGTIEEKVVTGVPVQMTVPVAAPAIEAEVPMVEEPLPVQPLVEEAVVEEPVKDEDDLSPDEIQAMLDSLSTDPEAFAAELEAEQVIESEQATVEPEPEPEPIIEEAPTPAVDIPDDPNAQLTPEQIAALFSGAASVPASEPEPEPESEPIIEEAPAPAVDIPDDPNAQLTPEQIAALFSGAASVPASEPEPEPEPTPEPELVQVPDVGVDLSDPNRVMSPEEIEKLFANL